MVPENFTSEMGEKAWRMYEQGRKKEADQIYKKLRDSGRVAELAASRVMEKLNVALVQEPGLLSGVEEQVQWIQSKFMRLGVLHGYDFTEELMDVAYDFEDAIDDLVLRSAAKRRRRNWESCFLLIRIHKKLENIKSKFPRLPPAIVLVPCALEIPKYLEEMQWSPKFSIATQNLEEAVVYPLKKKLSALLDLKALHPEAKNRVRRVLDQLESLAIDLRGLKSADLDDREMVWMEKLANVSLSGVNVIEDFIIRHSAQFRRRSWIVQYSFGKSKSHKLAMEMDQLCSKIQSLSISKPAKGDEPTKDSDEPTTTEDEIDEPATEDAHKPESDEDDNRSITEDKNDLTTEDEDEPEPEEDNDEPAKVEDDEPTTEEENEPETEEADETETEEDNEPAKVEDDEPTTEEENEPETKEADEPAAEEDDEPTTGPNNLNSSFKIEESAIKELNFDSFADDVHAMTTRLLADDKSFCVIPIMGMEGIGKTTLAKFVLNSKSVLHHFPFRVWPSVRDHPYHVLLDIVNVTSYAIVSSEGEKMITKPKDFFTAIRDFFTANRSLIVIDDPCGYGLDDLLLALAGTSNGSRLIWITRKMNLPPKVGARSDPHPLRLRTDEESWTLFAHALKVGKPQELERLKGEILRRCEGLPVLIIKLAEAFSREDATSEEWESSISTAVEPEKFWSSTLDRIYRDLSLYTWRCLFALSLFPENYDVPARRLITLWVAENLLQTEGNNEHPEDVAEECLNLLIAQGMLQVAKKKLNGNVKAVRLPGALRQYWLSKVQEAAAPGNYIYTRSELFLGNDMIRRLVDHLDRNDVTFPHIHGGSSTSSTSLRDYYEDVISFRSFDTRKRIEPEEEIGIFLGRCIRGNCLLHLWVLDLENVYKPKLPEAVGELTQLKYLGLRSTFLEKLPSSISKLRNLQTLDIKHTDITILPTSIWKLQQLRHLYLDDRFRSKLRLPSRIGSIATLQTLCGLFVDEETRVTDGLNRLLNLRKLGLTMSSQVQAVTDWVLNLTHIQSLRVKSIGDDGQPCDLELKSLSGLMNLSYIFLLGRLRNPSIVYELPSSLVDLTLSWSQLTEDPMQPLCKLPNLKCLKLLAKSYVGKSMHCCKEGFPQLRVLKLWKLDEVEEWKVEEGALQALRDLEIRYSERPLEVPQELVNRSPILKINVRLAPKIIDSTRS